MHLTQLFSIGPLGLIFLGATPDAEGAYAVKPPTKALAKEYKLDRGFYKKVTMIQGILIATSSKVANLTHRETAYQFDMLMRGLKPEIAERIRKKKVLCLLIGHDELTSQLPQFSSSKTGEELDFYNWRQRGFLTYIGSRPTVVFAEEDVMEYPGGMQLESILVHEFGHVVHGVGFDESLQKRLSAAFENVKNRDLERWSSRPAVSPRQERDAGPFAVGIEKIFPRRVTEAAQKMPELRRYFGEWKKGRRQG